MFSKIFKSKKSQKRAYEGATLSSSFPWTASASLANLEIQKSLVTLNSRARDLVRNNSYAESAVSKISSNLIGTGIIHDFNSEIEQEIFKKWAESTKCDVNGVLTYYGIQELIVREMVEVGECLVRKVQAGYSRKGNSIPLKLRVLSSEYLDITKNGMTNPDNGNFISQGVEIDAIGERIAYWLYPYHPENDLGWRQQSVRVPASEIIHIYKPKRADQTRGISWLAPVIIDLKMLDNYQTSELKRKEINSTITGFLTDFDDNSPTSDYENQNNLIERIKPGTLLKLTAGKSVTLTNPQSDGNYDQYVTSVLRKISSGLNISYEVLTGDLSKVNFSSGRMGFLEFQRQIEIWRWNTIIPTFCEKISEWFLETCQICGINTDNVTNISYTAPRREMIDPVKETNAIILAIRNGLISYEEAVKQLGYNPEETLNEIQEFNQILDEKKIVLDCDPRKTTQQGIFQTNEEVEENE